MTNAKNIASLRRFFQPRVLAVIGASRDPSSLGHRMLQSASTSFQGAVYPINPKASTVGGLRSYSSVFDLPETPDVAVICVPRQAVLQVVDDCARAGIQDIVMITAGFAEADEQGIDLQQKLAEKIRNYGMRLIGPNCVGLINTDPAVRLNATFLSVSMEPGHIAVGSQSGAIGLVLMATARSWQLAFSSFVSVGNEVDVSATDLLEYWGEDSRTDVILLYLESFKNPRRFAEVARCVSQRKPILAIKAGRTKAGQRAAGSHTAALATSEVAVNVLFQRSGVVRAESLVELLDLAAMFANQPLSQGRRIGIVTNAGGLGVLCADACDDCGLELPELSSTTKDLLARFLAPAASVQNPIDMTASARPEDYRRAIEVVLTSGDVDAVVVIYVPVEMVPNVEFSRSICEGVIAARTAGMANKPVVACVISEQVRPTPLVLGTEAIPCCVVPEAAARVLSQAVAYAEWRARLPGTAPELAGFELARAREICAQATRQRGSGWLTTDETREVLTAIGLPVAPGAIAMSADEAVEVARRVGFPVAMKTASNRVIHKLEIGAVRLNLGDEAVVRGSFEDIARVVASHDALAMTDGVLVQPILSGVELFVGATHDPLFGPLIAFGLGGTDVEVLADVCWRMTPLTDRDAAEMIHGIRGFPLLSGHRRRTPVDLAAIEQVLLRVARMMEELSSIRELDINPMFARGLGEGCCVADARILVACNEDGA